MLNYYSASKIASVPLRPASPNTVVNLCSDTVPPNSIENPQPSGSGLATPRGSQSSIPKAPSRSGSGLARPQLRKSKSSTPKTPSRFATIKQQQFFDTLTTACCDLYLTSSTTSAKSIVGRPMQDFLEDLLGKAVVMPARSTIYRRIPQRYQFFEQAMMKYVRENTPGVIGIVFDVWTESGGSRRSFLNTCLQFSVNFRVINISLATSYIDGEHTGQCIADEVYGILRYWGLTKKFIFFVRDKGANVVL